MQVESKLQDIRKEIMLTACGASVAHIASAYSIVEILYSLYINKKLNFNSKNPKDENRDRFILSKGHGSLALYSILSEVGFFSKDELKKFAKPDTYLGGEPTYNIPGVEASTGSLGHGLSLGVGMALAYKLDDKPNKVYVLLGDGECEEGTIWEAIMFAVHQKLDNLIMIVDSNKIQKMNTLENIMSVKTWKDKFEAFGLNVVEVDGHNVNELDKVFEEGNKKDVPMVVLANTIKGKGVSIIENDPRWHFKLPSKKEMKTIMQELNITEEEYESCKKHM